MQGGWRAAIQAVRDGRHGLRRQHRYAKRQTGVMRKRRYAEQATAASVIGFAAGVVVRHAAVVVVNGAVRMGMGQAIVMRRRARTA